MSGLTVKVLLQDIRKLDIDALVVGFYDNVRPLRNLAGELDWLLCGALSRLVIDHTLRGAVGDAALLNSRGKVPARKIFLMGLGHAGSGSVEALASAAETAITTVLKAGVRKAAVEYFAAPGLSFEAGVPALCSGIASALRGQEMEITLLSPNAAAHEQIARLVPAAVGRQRGG